MIVTYVGPDEARIIAATGRLAARGEPIEVPDAVGAALCEQADQWAANPAEEES